MTAVGDPHNRYFALCIKSSEASVSPSYMCTLARTLDALGTAALAHVRRTARMCTPITTQAVDQGDEAPVGIQPLTFACTPTSPRGS